MSERDDTWHHSPGPQIDAVTGRRKLYDLLAYFMASRSISDLCDDGDFCPFRALIDDFEEQSIVHGLIEIAVLLRLKDDLFEQQHGVQAGTRTKIVGSITIDAVEKGLDLREACNKIIHARHLHFDSEREEDVFNRYLNPVIHLHGEHKGKSWVAKLDIVEWVRFAVALLPR